MAQISRGLRNLSLRNSPSVLAPFFPWQTNPGVFFPHVFGGLFFLFLTDLALLPLKQVMELKKHIEFFQLLGGSWYLVTWVISPYLRGTYMIDCS